MSRKDEKQILRACIFAATTFIGMLMCAERVVHQGVSSLEWSIMLFWTVTFLIGFIGSVLLIIDLMYFQQTGGGPGGRESIPHEPKAPVNLRGRFVYQTILQSLPDFSR